MTPATSSSLASNTFGGARVRVPPPAVYLGAALAGAALGFIAPLRLPISRWAGIALGLAAAAPTLVLGGVAYRAIVKSGQDPKPWEPTPVLVGGGSYQLSRNPMYLGMAGLTLGIGLATRNAWGVLAAPLALALVHLTAVVPEEAYLEERFGEAYRSYKADVRRYV